MATKTLATVPLSAEDFARMHTEVPSPSERAMDLRRKVRDYLRGAARRCGFWIMPTARCWFIPAAGFAFFKESMCSHRRSLPGFAASVAELVVSPEHSFNLP
jgi:hypothetical protein